MMITLEELNIPELRNETRLAALYGRIPSVDVDASKRADMLKFWETAIDHFCQVKGSSVFTLHELHHAFKTKEGITPLSLRTVVKLLLNKSETSSCSIRDEREFMETLSSSNTSSSSGTQLPSALISAFRGLTSWLTSTVKAKLAGEGEGGDDEEESEEARQQHRSDDDERVLVWVSRVKSNTERVTKALRSARETTSSGSSTSLLFTMDDFQSVTTNALSTTATTEDRHSSEELRLVLANLVRSKQAILYHKNKLSSGDEEEGGALDDRFLGIKLLTPSTLSSSASPSSSTSPDNNDRSVLLLKHTIRSLEKQIAQLEDDCDKCRDSAKQLLSKKRKNEAILQLHRQKQLKSLLGSCFLSFFDTLLLTISSHISLSEKRSSALYNLQTVLETIEQTQTDREVS